MALPEDDQEWVSFLARMHDRDIEHLRELNSLYEGTAPLAYMHPEILREVGDRIKPVALGWPMLAVDPIEERLDVLGFRYPDDSEDVDADAAPQDIASNAGDRNLQQVWKDNNLDVESQLAHIDALVMKRSYVTVGTNEDDPDTPLSTVESPLEMFAYIDPRTRRVLGALRRWRDEESFVRVRERFATLYLPERTVHFRDNGGWRVDEVDEHGLGEVPVVPLTNRARVADRYGKSELNPALLSLSHAANKIATDMMVAAEFHAIPLRAIFGIGPEDLVDENGNRMTALQAIMGRMLAVPADGDGESIKPHQFEPTNLKNYHDTLNQLARHVAALIGLPPHTVGFIADNPASAEGILAAEVRMVNRAERIQLPMGGGWKRWAGLVRRFQEGEWDPRAKRIETIWRDASTPTRAQAADAAVKLFTTQPEPIVTKRQVREDLGYTPGQIRRMEAEDSAESQRRLDAALANALSIPEQGGQAQSGQQQTEQS